MTDSKPEFLADSNILIYAFDTADRDKHIVAKDLLSKCWRGEITLAVSVQNINEFCRVATKKIAKPLEPDTVKGIVELIIRSDNFVVLHIDVDTIISALEVYKENKESGYWDCLLAATMKQNGISAIYTENTKDFEASGMKAVNPFTHHTNI